MTFGAFISAKRKELRLTLRETAKHLGIACGYGTITGCSGYHIVPFTGQYFPRTESAALWWHYGYCRPKTFTKNQSEENCSGSQGR